MSNPNFDAVATAYKDGLVRMDCPCCEGGDTRERGTMSVWRNDFGRVIGQCWRAKCGATITAGIMTATEPKVFVPNPLTKAYRSSDGELFGQRCLVDEPSTAVWQLHALDSTHTGHITRTKDKAIRTYKEVDRPLYYVNKEVFYASPTRLGAMCLWIFEDCMSAAACRLPAIALLGTSISPEIVEEIREFGTRKALVALDPGAEEAALRVYEKLVAGGVPATFVPMPMDFKDMAPADQRALEEAYS